MNHSINPYDYNTYLEAQWAHYFERAGIQVMYRPHTYHLSGGCELTPTFYLPQFTCFTDVMDDPTRRGAEPEDRQRYRCLKRLVIETGIQVVVAEGPPAFNHYSMLVPENSQLGYTVEQVNMLADPNVASRLLVHRYFKQRKMFEEAGLDHIIAAVESAQSLAPS